MSELQTAVRPTLHDLFTHLRELERLPRGEDPARFMEAPLAKVEAGLGEALAQGEDEVLSQDVAKLRELIASRAEVEGAEDRGQAWAGFRERLEKAYDALRPTVKGLPELRPTNYARSVMHVTTAVVCLLLVEHVLSPMGMIITAAVGAVWCWAMEIGRIFSKSLNDFLLRSMAAVAHPHERRHVNSATWYTTALLVLALLFTPKVCVVALAVLGLADPAAGFVGRRWGRIKLVNGRSLEGTTAFMIVGTLAGLAALSIWHPDVHTGLALLISAGAAFAGAVTELFSKRIDDNLSIPIAAACGAWAVALAAL